jgi:hypothetical protein
VNYIVNPQDVRDYLKLEPTGDSRYSDAMLYTHILGATAFLEKECRRFLADRTFTYPTDIPWVGTTMLAAEVPIPGFRSFSKVTWGGSDLTVALPGTLSGGCWAIPDNLSSGVYTALQFRAWRTSDNPEWWRAHSDWWDRGYDSPFFPGNLGGGFAWTSIPNDLTIYGQAGWASGSEPEAYRHALLMLSAFYTKRATSVLADVAITPNGGVIKYSRMPDEVRGFIDDWKIGEQAVSVG